MPEIGKAGAASVSSGLQASYRNIELALVVGFCGGVPSLPHNNSELILGDVILSDSVVDYNFGRQYPDGFQRKNTVNESLGRPSRKIRSILACIKSCNAHIEFRNLVLEHLRCLQVQERRACVCADCNSDQDPVCTDALKCDCKELRCAEKVIPRHRLKNTPEPEIHIGTMASADTVMKSGRHHDKLAEKEGIIGFEMEGAGVWGNIPCMIIKGVCDYTDSHKNKRWHAYATATAAAAAKTFLTYWDSGRNEIV
ncbi:nucleoside phosphorylase domain-containing protein [Aspergillus granulosus]|uniref:Nucleoside phosphorylase domain-containing protein n=1 Tax=Aspergillus granulosus TaxID=176169 RepID=A0ABR4GTP2_9EURO